ncbi:MAG: hypothetical protein M1832_003025 [Thelocarpon impressellum]|nr:MAG: hypothetical protein M1832_003025 [Thelocarpon impressellum]
MAAVAADGGGRDQERPQSAQAAPVRNPTPAPSRLGRWWRQHIAPIAPPESDVRDYLALERTFLAHIRTSTVLAMTGVLVAQLHLVSTPHTPDSKSPIAFGRPAVGKTLACALVAAGALEAGVGGWRYMRFQRRLVAGRALGGGWDMLGVWGLLLAV